ncbi:barstar family protein [Streptomyces antibioticus]|uniref:barstar family protein n=1 Tax=Streptomyces antibioticus TaxID=1890 RepID=UPI00277B5362|nr:barstar family protein [Streptomyces antibioticus]
MPCVARFYWAVPRLVNWCRTRLLVAPPVLVHVRNGTTTCKHVAVITIDVSEVTDERALHLLLMRDLGFPGFYGMNLDAFWDSITGSGSRPCALPRLGPARGPLSPRVHHSSVGARQLPSHIPRRLRRRVCLAMSDLRLRAQHVQRERG